MPKTSAITPVTMPLPRCSEPWLSESSLSLSSTDFLRWWHRATFLLSCAECSGPDEETQARFCRWLGCRPCCITN